MKLLISLFILLFYIHNTFAQEKIVYYEDKSADMNISEVLKLPLESYQAFETSSFGRTSSVFWIKAVFENRTQTRQDKVLEFKETRLNRVDVFDKQGHLQRSMGDCIPFVQREFNDPNVAIKFTLPPETIEVKYLRVSTQSIMSLDYNVWDLQQYQSHVVKEIVVNALYFGASLIMLIYNFVLFLFIRERAFFDYVVYHVVLLISLSFYTGVYGQVLFPYDAGLRANGVTIELVTLSTLMATQFMRSFLQTFKISPKLDMGLKLFMGVNLLSFVFALFSIGHNINSVIVIVVMIVQSIYLLAVSVYIGFIRHYKIAQFYFLGWFIMMLGIIVTGLISLGLVPRNDFTTYMFQLGSITEIALFSMGLAYRYKINQDQLREKSQVLHEQSKLAAMGEMMRHIAHQWRQPLSEINSVAMKIETEHRKHILDDVSLDKNIEQIESITEHMSKTIQDFNSYFKSDKAKTKTTLEAVVDKALGLVMGGLSKNDIRIEKEVEADETVEIVEGELVQVLLVLLNNARDALNASDVAEKWIKIRIAKENEKYLIEVEDSAGGIEERNLEKVFEPYFTTKFESQGVGIGLYMSKMIVEESLGGRLTVENAKKGALFKIIL